MPPIDAAVAFVVVHASVADCPWSMTDGVTRMLAVGTGVGGGGGGGGAGATTFLWHPARMRIVPRQSETESFVSLESFT
jgi:hypothetical protein